MTTPNQYADRIPKEIRSSRMLLAAIIDNHGQILFYNDLLGGFLHPHTASHLHYSELIHQDDLENFRSALSIALSGKMVSNIMARIPSAKKGTDHNVVWEITPAEDSVNKEHFVLAVGTQLQKSELQKVVHSSDSEVIENLMRRNRDLEQFANIVSHNIRSPLANIMGLNKLLNLKLNEADREMALKGIRVSAEKLEGVIKDLNDVLQVRGKEVSCEDAVSLLALVDDIRLSLGDIITQNNVTIICDFEEVPEIRAVKSYIQSIFYNLITNGIKYAKPGVPAILKISSAKKDNHVEITFADNGTGIDLERHGSNLFGLYKRFTDRVEGKGLGLYMVKTQVEVLHGTIDVQSVVGEGTTFTVTLPI